MADDKDLQSLLKSIRQIARAVDIHSRRLDRAVGLTLPQMIVLRSIRDLGEVTSRAISNASDLSAPTVVGILDKLEAKRLIERYRSSRDRRVVHTRLTEAGRALLNRAPSPLGDHFADTFDALTKTERRAVLKSVDRVAQMLAPLALEQLPDGDEDAESAPRRRLRPRPDLTASSRSTAGTSRG
jgi:DNA-binding MarR family transcriptional regulator